MIYLLDTDTLTHSFANHPRVVQHAAQVAGEGIGTTIVTKIEMLRGRFDAVVKASDEAELLRAQALLLKTEEQLNRLLVVPFDEAAAAHFSRLHHGKRLKKIGRADLLIACIVLARKATLVTRNLRHFRQIPGLKMTNWVD